MAGTELQVLCSDKQSCAGLCNKAMIKALGVGAEVGAERGKVTGSKDFILALTLV